MPPKKAPKPRRKGKKPPFIPDKLRRRDFAFTAFVPVDAPTCRKPIQPEKELAFQAWQYEICETTRRLHIQGYVYWKNAKEFSKVKELVFAWCGVHACFIIPNGTPAQNAAYCSKEKTRVEGTKPFTFGECPIQGTSWEFTTLTIVASC